METTAPTLGAVAKLFWPSANTSLARNRPEMAKILNHRRDRSRPTPTVAAQQKPKNEAMAAAPYAQMAAAKTAVFRA